MGKRRAGLTLALVMALWGSGVVWAAGTGETSAETMTVLEETDRRIEQVYMNLPEVYVYGSGFTMEEVRQGEGYLAAERLELVDQSVFSESGEGICYYVLLDISGSMPNRYFRSVKTGIQNLQDSLRPQDRLVLCTFGEDVFLAADGNQDSGQMMEALASIENRDQKTLLFEGIDRVAALTEQKDVSAYRRKVLAVISDGEDIAVGKKMAQEAQATLREKGIPAYAFCIRDTASANINTFGEFARMSGGDIVTFLPEEGEHLLTDLAAELQDDLCIRYQADTNVVSNKEEQFILKFQDGTTQTRPVMNSRWIPDLTAPVLKAAEAVGEQQIRLTFSEPLSGLEMSANYHLMFDEKPVGITGVSYDKNDKLAVNLSLAEPVQNGEYMLACSNITDLSMEKNALAGTMSVAISNAPEQKETPKEVLKEDYSGLLFLIFAAVVILIIILIVLMNKKKKDTDQTDQDTLDAGETAAADAYQEEPLTMDGSGFRQHIAMASPRGMQLQVHLVKNGMYPKDTVWEIGSSLIVGRSSICDVAVDDSEMSRQHFCLEADHGNIYITDLGSTNGTMVNGIRIYERRRLEPGTVVGAGSMKITIRW